jgi:hypothetical protein
MHKQDQSGAAHFTPEAGNSEQHGHNTHVERSRHA